jgi:pimeloyl-ACP methyl ester carboxylesterase
MTASSVPPPEPGYIETPAGVLFRLLHLPAGASRGALLLVPPCGDEKRAAYGPLAGLARDLSAAGWAVLRFDFLGTGDSAGESTDVTVSGMERDTRAAAAELARLFPGAPLELLGVRLGGSLALRLAAGLGARSCAAVAPVTAGAAWLRQERGRRKLRRSMVRKELAAAGQQPGEAAGGNEDLPAGAAEDLDGLPVSADFIREMEAFDPCAGDAPPVPAGEGPRTLVVQVSPRRTPLPDLERLAGRFGAEVRCLHLESFWRPAECPDLGELSACLVSWLELDGR